ncbi:MAG: single-stranded DNA-binding protein [Thaumarchaeota archaeon]|nr:single-stranded DNA-binding protein [Nitrososphaerota archaeon]MBT4175254.1 single-stranded DNA-binding protein [Nitrososphaerota archaeon]MBT4510234.1 single-stranded DNA-binding protein [Nitrososphaerota archaeon]MBT4676019.1 single-stranded DNA-binding protein [Nitrososphaerota archaeon]MBT4973757.1 single-stranded DNA-binding protein [Nitrososphaerota archaeon]
MSEFEELISKLLEKVPELSRSVIEERINEKKEKVGAGYLTDQGAIFLVAADLGVSLEQTQNSEVAIKDLYIGAKEVTLESRVLNISPTKQFTKKDGSSFSLRTITVYDNNSTASVKLWDEKANLPGLEELKPGDLIKIIKAYVKSDLTGAPTINIGSGSTIETSESESDIVSIDSKISDVSEIKDDQRDLIIAGTLGSAMSLLEFTNSKGKPSKALKFRLRGANKNLVNVVLWGKDESILPKVINQDAKVKLFGVRTKTGMQGLEIHGNDATIIDVEGNAEIQPTIVRLLAIEKDQSGNTIGLAIDKSKKLVRITDVANTIGSFVKDDILECMPSKIFGNTMQIDQDSFVRKIDDKTVPTIAEIRTKITEVKEGNDYSVEAIVLKAPERKDIQTKNGDNIQLSEMFVEDDSGQVWIKGWRQQADLMDSFTLGDIITILGVNARPGLEGKLDLVLTPYSKIIKKN